MNIIIRAWNQGYSPEEADFNNKGYTIDDMIKTLKELKSEYGGDCHVFTKHEDRRYNKIVYGRITNGDIYAKEGG